MRLQGKNRYMVVDLHEQKEQYSEGDVVAFPRHLLQEFVFKGETFYLVLENHILCSIEGD